MKIIKEEIIPAQEERKIQKDRYYCDLCGKEILNPANNYGSESAICYQEDYGNYGSDGGFDYKYCFDLCEDCIKEKVFPLIEKHLKIKPRYDERDW